MADTDKTIVPMPSQRREAAIRDRRRKALRLGEALAKCGVDEKSPKIPDRLDLERALFLFWGAVQEEQSALRECEFEQRLIDLGITNYAEKFPRGFRD
jgi:hypothetical protein